MDNGKAAAGFIGLKVTNRKEHLVRAILEGIVFGVYNLFKKCPVEYRLNSLLR